MARNPDLSYEECRQILATIAFSIDILQDVGGGFPLKFKIENRFPGHSSIVEKKLIEKIGSWYPELYQAYRNKLP